MNIYVNEIDKVKEFVNRANNVATDILVKSIDKRYCVDGRSILGIFSLDLSKEVTVLYHDSEVDFENFLKTLQK